MIGFSHFKIKPWRQSLGRYWQQSRRPLAALLFVLPLLAAYEGGLLLLGSTAVRNGADLWLRNLLGTLGLGSYFLLPILTIAGLLAWHHTTRDAWRISPRVIGGMAIESAVLGLVLLAGAHLQGELVAKLGSEASPLVDLALGDFFHALGRTVGYFGAGIYEEVLFRLLLLPAVAGLIALAGGSARVSIVGAMVLTSITFAAAHYVGPHGDAFTWFTFAFRLAAGGFFAVLLVYRGFGIAAGTHALYDVLAGTF